MNDDTVMAWLMRGDPAIGWQALRDLRRAPPAEVEAARARVATEGWGRRLLDLQHESGRWSADRGPARFRGLYTPKWTSTTYTLLLLRRLGLPARHPGALAGCRELVQGADWFESGGLGYFPTRDVAETCVSAMVLSVLEAFDHQDQEARQRLRRYLLEAQMEDGGWNCRIGSTHSSFHTSILALEALQLCPKSGELQRAAQRGREFFLRHRMYCSCHTGKVVKSEFKRFAPPYSWRYDVLRGLDHFATTGAARDPRLEDAISLVRQRRRHDGRWAAHARSPGGVHFELESARQPSRWATLVCLRVLRWWQGAQP